MATSNYDVNVQLTLATTAELEGDFDSALAFIAEAHRVSREDGAARFQVFWFTARFRTRNVTSLPMMKRASLAALASAF